MINQRQKLGRILIVGGYGKVGSNIASLLSQSYAGEVYVAGRSLAKAKVLSQQLDGAVLPMELDITKAVNPAQLQGVSLVIMCYEQADCTFAKLVMECGIQYIDITASYAAIKQLESLQSIAESNDTVGMLSVGLAPGLTNLMAAHMYDGGQGHAIRDIEISILLGAGDKHGDAAIQWILQQLNEDYDLLHTGRVRNFTGRRSVNFSEVGARSVYRFNFSDQHTLQASLPDVSFTTSLGFDLEWLNSVLAFLQWSRAGKLLKSNVARNTVTKLIQSSSIGSQVCGVRVDAAYKDGSSRYLSFMGKDESLLTAHMVTLVTKKLMEQRLAGGIYQIQQCFRLDLVEGATAFTEPAIVARGV